MTVIPAPDGRMLGQSYLQLLSPLIFMVFAAGFMLLYRQARDLQIIVLTCRARAFERLGGQGLRMTDWRPQD